MPGGSIAAHRVTYLRMDGVERECSWSWYRTDAMHTEDLGRVCESKGALCELSRVLRFFRSLPCMI
jgi:hypothetical protein